MRRHDELLIGEWSVLALLCEAPSHGYAVAAEMGPEGEIGRIWTLSQALTYRAIDVLQQRGLLRVLGEAAGNAAPRRIELAPTPRARALVNTWLETPERHLRDLRSGLVLKLTFRTRAGLSLQPLLSGQREMLHDREAELREGAVDGDLASLWRHTMALAALDFVDRLDPERSGGPTLAGSR